MLRDFPLQACSGVSPNLGGRSLFALVFSRVSTRIQTFIAVDWCFCQADKNLSHSLFLHQLAELFLEPETSRHFKILQSNSSSFRAKDSGGIEPGLLAWSVG